MKTFFPTAFLFLITTAAATAQTERYVTLTVRAPEAGIAETNTYQIADGEAAEPLQGYSCFVTFQKNGYTFANWTGPIAGPFTIKVVSYTDPAVAGIQSFKIKPMSFPPDKTVVIAPTSGLVAVTMETSTNLVTWATATNGIYGGTNEAHFFRIRLDKLN